MNNKALKGGSVKRNPFLQGKTPLSFDGISEDELLAMTPEEQQAKFVSKWMEIMDPYVSYPKVFTESESKRILRDVKTYFKKMVLDGQWSEKKYVTIINAIFEQRGVLAPKTLERYGSMFDDERLPSQVRARRDKR